MPEKLLYKTRVVIEVISHNPFHFHDLQTLDHDITDGECSGKIDVSDSVEIKGKEALELIMAQGTDPEFFGMNRHGNDADDGPNVTAAKLVLSCDDGTSVFDCDFDLETRTAFNIKAPTESSLATGCDCSSWHILLHDGTRLLDFHTQDGTVFVNGSPEEE
jgi:hypothetical protein